jgi:hypothetical protein
MPAGQAPTDQLDTTDFDNPVAVGYRHAGSFGIEYNGSGGHLVLSSQSVNRAKARILSCGTPSL